MEFDDDDVRQVIEMVNLMKLGLDDQELMKYYTNKDIQNRHFKKSSSFDPRTITFVSKETR